MSRPSRERLLAWLRLHLAFLGRPDLAVELLAAHGGPEEALACLGRGAPGLIALPPAVRAALLDPRAPAAAEAELAACAREGTRLLTRDDAGWPENLSRLEGMPLLLFVRGALLPEDARAVGVVGSRRPSPHGLRQSERFAAGLAARGVTVVSGLARGIDAAAHRGALAAGGRTIAVLGSGFGRLYPPEHDGLAREIAASGVLLTEFPRATPPRQHHFPHRNRILSGLALGVLVVEAGERSGSLITATWALEQDRPVYALPGRADALEARGGLRLLQEGARLVLDPEEILQDLGLERENGRDAADRGGAPGGDGHGGAGPVREGLPAELARLFREEDSWFADQIVERLARPPAEVLAELARLESEGLLLRLPGGAYAAGA